MTNMVFAEMFIIYMIIRAEVDKIFGDNAISAAVAMLLSVPLAIASDYLLTIVLDYIFLVILSADNYVSTVW